MALNENWRKIGFIPIVLGKDDLIVSINEAEKLYQEELIDEVFLNSKLGIWKKVGQPDGIPHDKIFPFADVGSDGRGAIKKLICYLKETSNPSEIVVVRIIAPNYACARLHAQLVREQLRRSTEMPGLLTGISSIHPKHKSLEYVVNFLFEPFRIFEDLAKNCKI